MKNKLSKDFFLSSNVIEIAKNLLGKELVVNNNGSLSSGIITETEAYVGIKDKASHAYNNRRTKRTETMFLEGGVAYVYLCYGMHYLFNVVTNVENQPDAVLIRSILPIRGVEVIKSKYTKINGKGPGRVTKLLGITKEHNAIDLIGNNVYIIDNNMNIPKKYIISTTRIGIDYAEEDAFLPYRFIIEEHYLQKFASSIKQSSS